VQGHSTSFNQRLLPNREGPPGWAEHPLRTSGFEIKLNGEEMEINSSGALRAPGAFGASGTSDPHAML
jgi:hypothetical protein